VQTLHHYDKIGLLKPSLRAANGYRMYSDRDLLKLQQIMALKYFGFKLADIKILLNSEVNMIEHFNVQLLLLREKADRLYEASKIIEGIVSEYGNNKSISWEDIIKSIEVFTTTEKLEVTWAGRILDPKGLKEYAQFERDLKSRLTESQKKELVTQWEEMISTLKSNLESDPRSEYGRMIFKRLLDLSNKYYGKGFAALRATIWERGCIEGLADEKDHGLSQEMITWINTALDAYFRTSISAILAEIDSTSNDKLIHSLDDLLTELCGYSKTRRETLLNEVLEDDKISQKARILLKKYYLEWCGAVYFKN